VTEAPAPSQEGGGRPARTTAGGQRTRRRVTAFCRGKASKGRRRRGSSATVAFDIRVEHAPLKHGEPHDWLQGATDLRSHERSKPSESGGTTWTERVGRLDGDLPKDGRRLVWEWTLVVMLVEGSFDEPHERSLREGRRWKRRCQECGQVGAASFFGRDSSRIVQRIAVVQTSATLHTVVGWRSQNASREGKGQRPFTVCGRHRATEGRTIRLGTLEGRFGRRVAIHGF